MSSGDSPVAQALSTDVILLYIFQNLGTKDLLDCRLVNQRWHSIASEALYPRGLYIDHYRLSYPEGNFDKCKGRVEWQVYCENLAFLANRFLQNPNFRYLGFSIGPMPSREELESIWEFAEFCGKHLRRLHIPDILHARKLPAVLALFNEIEHLHVGGSLGSFEMPAGEDAIRFLTVDGRDISLPKLRCLRVLNPHRQMNRLDLSGTRQLFEELMNASPNLKKIECFDVSFTEAAIKCGKLNAASDLSLHYPDFNVLYLPHLKLFSEKSPPLTSFSCTGFYRWVQNSRSYRWDEEKRREFVDLTLGSVDRILSASKDTLKHLRIDYLQKPPKLTKLSSLHIVDRTDADYDYSEAEPYRIFPSEWECAPRSYFPVLRTVRLELSHYRGDAVKAHFGDFEDDTFPTVTTLELACPFDDARIKALGIAFPCVKTLRVFWDKCKYSYVSDLWVFSPALKFLEILNFRGDENFQEFEVAVVGFYPEVCEKLRKRRRIPCDADDLDSFRTCPSILELKGLERFSVHFVCGRFPERAVLEYGLTPIAQWYALGLMPKLKTQFVYDFKDEHADVLAKVLEPYKPYISVMSE